MFALRYILHPVTKDKMIDLDFSLEIHESEIPSLMPTLASKTWTYRASKVDIKKSPKNIYVGFIYHYGEVEVMPIEEWNPNRKLRKGVSFVNLAKLDDTEIELLPLKQEFRSRTKKVNPRSERLHCFIPFDMDTEIEVHAGKHLYSVFLRGIAKPELLTCPYPIKYRQYTDLTFGVTVEDKKALYALRLPGEPISHLILRAVYNGLIE